MVSRPLGLLLLAVSSAQVARAQDAQIDTLFPYIAKHHNNPGAGNWWGMSFAVTKHGTVLAGGLLKLDVAVHAEPTVLMMKRSADGGHTWGNASILMGDPYPGNANSTEYMGGSFVYSARTDTVFFLYMNSDPGPSNSSVHVIRSHDDGRSWSSPTIASDGSGATVFGGEVVGHGIELQKGPHAGRLMLPVTLFFGNVPRSPGFDLRSWVVYSDDNGATWRSGDFMPPPHVQLEASIAELANGSVLLTARNGQLRSASNLCEAGQQCRVFARSDDGGATWSEQWYTDVHALPVHRCEAAMVSTDDGTLYFGGPMNSTTGDRTNYTIYSSTDGGKHWSWVTGVFGGPSGYSDIAFLPDGQLGVGFQLGHNRHGVVGGGYDFAYARVNVTTSF